MANEAALAYSRRAAEYADLFGSMAAVHPSDRQLVDTWADAVTGSVIDAGCGPGHWTNYLVQRGTLASGVDLTPDLIALARARYPRAKDASELRQGGSGWCAGRDE